MALTHRVTSRIELPHELGQWIEVRMPSMAILDRARQARSRKAIDLVMDLDLSKLKGLATAEQQDTGPDYDWQALLAGCVIAWSYPEAVTPDNVGELDEQTVNTILAVLVPKHDEGERKND